MYWHLPGRISSGIFPSRRHLNDQRDNKDEKFGMSCHETSVNTST